MSRALAYPIQLPRPAVCIASGSRRAFASTPRPAVLHKCPASYYRGGTSRAIIFDRRHLPTQRSQWDEIFRAVIGSPDPVYGRQLDGMGGGISSLSKICVVEPSSDSDIDVDYTFAAIGVRDDEVDYTSNCGNMSSAIGPFAVETGLVDVKPNAVECLVRIRNTNTGKLIHATFPLDGEGNVAACGDFDIDGVAGTAPMIKLAFIDPAGSKTGKLLPTGGSVDVIDGVDATCIDVGNPCVFVSAESLQVSGDFTPAEIDAHPTLLSRLDSIRRQAGVLMGLADRPEHIPGSIPKIAMVSPPSPSSGGDVVVRALSVGQPHRAVPITVALAIAVAAQLPHSTVQRVSLHTPGGRGINISHASGKIMVDAQVDAQTQEVSEASVMRTARLLMKGEIYWTEQAKATRIVHA